MTGSTSQFYTVAVPRNGFRPTTWETRSVASSSPLARLRALLFGRRPEERRLPPLKNVHYVALHMAATTHLGSLH